VHERSSDRIELSELCERDDRILVVEPFPACPRAVLRRRRKLEVDERGPEVETGPAADNGDPRSVDELIDRSVGQARVLADRELLGKITDGDEPSRRLRLVGENRQAALHLERVRRDDLGRELSRNALRDRGLSRCGRPEDRNDLGLRRSHVLRGTPAHHPLRAYRRNAYKCVAQRVESVKTTAGA
jgi:hypothetical protein